MVEFEEFESLLKEPVNVFSEMDKVRIISHYDADGISSAAIILGACLREDKKVHLSIVNQIRPELIERLNESEGGNYIFTDLGSGHLEEVNKLDFDNLIVLDHHGISGSLEEGYLVNPHEVGLGEDSVSGAGVTYLFSREVSEDNKDLSYLAVVGAIGDIQEEDWKMKGMNERILEEAIDQGLIDRREGLRLFGRLSRPLHKALEYTTDPYIPGVSENESGAVQFLSDLDIDPKKDNSKWRKLIDLNEEERKELASSIIEERINDGMEDAEDIFGNVYTINKFDGKFRDARELSTALNASGRMSNASTGILACLGDEDAVDNLEDVVDGYKKLIGKYISKARDSDMVERYDEFVVLDGVGEIHENFIGTVISILQSSLANGKVIMGFASSDNGKLKLSMRVPDDIDTNVEELLEEITEDIGGEAGGHEKAGGGYIDEEKKKEFIDEVKDRLEG